MAGTRILSGNSLVAVPVLITLTVTLLRLAGELMGWSERLFNPEAGGGMAVVGIVWLIPFFAFYFGWRMTGEGKLSDSPWKILAFSIAGFALLIASMFAANAVFAQFTVSSILAAALGSVLVGFFTFQGSPTLFGALLRYGLGARIPVAVIMLFAMLGNWNTHYDAPPPGFPEMGVFARWVTIGLVPQLTVWITFTLVFGGFFAAIAVFLSRRRTGTV